MRPGLILYGPPASGKDTITAALAHLDPRYFLFPRLKVGPGRTAGYRLTTVDDLDRRREERDVIWENSRYGATYAVDLTGLRDIRPADIPVLHLGQVDAIPAVQHATSSQLDWTVVQLTYDRSEVAARLRSRGSDDMAARLAVYDATERLSGSHLNLDTSVISPEQAAATIHPLVAARAAQLSFESRGDRCATASAGPSPAQHADLRPDRAGRPGDTRTGAAKWLDAVEERE